MNTAELTTAFDNAFKTIKEQIAKAPPQEPWQADLVLASVLLLKEFLLDHKRSADALEAIAASKS